MRLDESPDLTEQFRELSFGNDRIKRSTHYFTIQPECRNVTEQSYKKGMPFSVQEGPRVMLKTIVKTIRCFLTDEEGPTAVEYAVMLMLIILVCIVGVQSVGRNTNQMFTDSTDQLNTAFGN
jgi:pilus assembly protein Flp/PilA